MCPDWIIAEVQDQFHSTLNDPWTYWREADKIKSMKMKTYSMGHWWAMPGKSRLVPLRTRFNMSFFSFGVKNTTSLVSDAELKLRYI